MIQLSSRKNIIILVSVILITIIFVVILIVLNKKPISPISLNNNQATSSAVRDMTKEEKIKVHVNPNQSAEVVNDQGGLYIYRIKK